MFTADNVLSNIQSVQHTGAALVDTFLHTFVFFCFSRWRSTPPRVQQVGRRSTHLPGALPGELLGQVASDASSPTGDQNHLPAQVLASARQERRHTRPDDVVEHLNREKHHATRAPQLHSVAKVRFNSMIRGGGGGE